MKKAIKEKQFQSLLKGLNIVFKVLLLLTSCAVLFFFILIIGASFTSEQLVMDMLEKGKIGASINFYGLKVMLSDPVINTFNYNKNMAITLFSIALFYTVIILSICNLIIRFLKSVINGDVFTLTNSKRIEYVALCIVILSFTIDSIQAYVIFAINDMFQLNSFIQKTEWIQSVSYQFFGIQWSMLLCGLVIWTIGKMFKYGSFLQDEYDATV